MNQARVADAIWNRALAPDGPDELGGDTALRAVLRFHTEAMSAGVRHAVGSFSDEELVDVQDAYRLYGFDDIARLIGSPVDDDADPDDHDELEEALDEAYEAVIPLDQTIVQAFEAHLRDNPDMYAPIEAESDGA
jgi:hypothetical protein